MFKLKGFWSRFEPCPKKIISDKTLIVQEASRVDGNGKKDKHIRPKKDYQVVRSVIEH